MISSIDTILLEVCFILPFIDFFSQFWKKNDIFKQYTMWNFYIFIKYFNHLDGILLHFLTSNFILIFIIFHSFFILQPELLHDMPKKMNMSKPFFHFQNFLFHIFPPIYCLTLSNSYYNEIHTHMYCNSFMILWIVIVEKGKLNLKGVYSINQKYRDKLLLLAISLNMIIPKILLYKK